MCEPCKHCSSEQIKEFVDLLYERNGATFVFAIGGRCDRMRAALSAKRKEIISNEKGDGRMDNGNALQVFGFEGNETRFFMENGELHFVAKDVAEALEYESASLSNMKTLIGAVPEEWKGRKRIMTLGGMQEMWCLSEQGLYFFLGRSDKPKALPYQKFIAGEVMPSIRKYGAYMTPATVESFISSPDFGIKLLTALKEEQEKNRTNAPLVLFANSVAASDDTILIGELAKLIRQNGMNIGQNRLFEWMRENGYLMKTGSSRNTPTQMAMEMELFRVLERTIDNPDGSIRITKTTKVTGKGQVYFVNLFLGARAA